MLACSGPNRVLLLKLEDVERVELLRDRTSRTVPGAYVGFIAGGITGGVIAHTAARDESDRIYLFWGPTSQEVVTFIGSFAGAAVGLVAGALIGSAHPAEHWERVCLPGQPAEER